jgi:hypothetical protein
VPHARQLRQQSKIDLEIAMGTIVHFKQAGRPLLPFEVQDGERAPAEALDRLTKARLWTAVGHLETALIGADKVRNRLPAGPIKDDFEQKLAALIRHLSHLREQIEQLLPHDGDTVRKPVKSPSGSSPASTKIYEYAP